MNAPSQARIGRTASSLAIALLVAAFTRPLPAQIANPVAPAEPAVRPLICRTYPNDTDGNRVEDALFDRAQAAEAATRTAKTLAGRAGAQAALTQFVDVELIFDRQVTQQQIDDFIAQGGQITHVYEAISYGWNGRLPLGRINALTAALGDALLYVEEDKPAQLHMDVATRTGRVRPIWASGFAANVAGFDGDTNITIGVVDTGVDESHMDLNGRRVFWHDYSSDAAANPIDIVQHGSHVAGMATGTGASAGAATGNLLFTDEGDLTGVPSGSFYPCPISFPSASITVNIVATWVGAGSTTLELLYHTRGSSSGYSVQSSVTGTSPLTLNVTLTPFSSRIYSPTLLSNGGISDYVVKVQVPSFAAVGDGFNKLRGVAPGCNWAGAKVFSNAGSGSSTAINAGIDGLVANRLANNIKVMNLSVGITGSPGISTTQRQKVNTAVNNGIVVVCSAGNDGDNSTAAAREIDDPGRAAMALTVGASDDVNQLTDYTSVGFTTPGSSAGIEEDYKPDLMAPGGSASYYTSIMSVDSNSGDGTAFADQRTNDYYNIQGTSMSAPFAAGCAALVIDALQQRGTNWDFASSQHARLVKMLLCATATESNTNRDSGANNPTLQRATAGPSSYPIGKDQYEGYGMINPDAAVEAASLSYTNGTLTSIALGPTVNDRRAWARSVSLPGGVNFGISLTVPASGDYDLYLYSKTPNAYGTPVLLASSTQAGVGVGEAITYTPPVSTNAILVVKRISGSGTFNLIASGPPVVDFAASATNGPAPLAAVFTNLTIGATNYAWDFGDGHTSTQANPTNTFANPGSYSVTLTAAGPGGTNALTLTNYIVVSAAPAVVANFTAAPTNGFAPLTVAFTNLSHNATSYAWDFGDGNSSTNTDPLTTYTNAGTYSVTLTATGPGGTNALTLTNYIVVSAAPAVVANFSAAPTNGFAPLTVAFTNLSLNATSYAWDFGDGNSSTNAAPVTTYTNAGSYSVTLTAAGPGGTNALTLTNYIVVSAAPAVVANFSAAPTNGFAPLTVNFTNLSLNASSYAWDFGDGNSSTNADPVNTYTNAGSYSVTLTAAGPGGTNALTLTNYILVSAVPAVVANFSAAPTNGFTPLTVNFTNLSLNATSYAWDFGDGNSSTNVDPVTTYTNAGTYSVTLTAAGPGGTNALTLTNYIVVAVVPAVVANFSAAPTNGFTPLTVNFTNLSLNATSYAWDFGDGNSSTNTDPLATYTNAGSYSVTLTAAGPGGTNALTLTNYIVVSASPVVVANFSAAPTNGFAPLTVNFTNLSLNATSYAWDFGDGNSSTNIDPVTTYTNAGTYSVTLTAAGPGGTNALTLTNYIVVSAAPVVVANFSAAPTNGFAPLTVAFTNLSLNATSYAWDFGDGNTSTNADPVNTYTNAGSYSVTLTAIGLTGTNALTLTNYIVVSTTPASLVVSPQLLHLGAVLTGAVSQASFVISNAGGTTLNASATLTPDQFQLLAPDFSPVPGLAFAVPGFAFTNVQVRFAPEAAGVFSNAVVFVTDGGNSTNAVTGVGFEPPMIVQLNLNNGEFTFAFTSVSGMTYDVQYTDGLNPPDWHSLNLVPGNGQLITITNLIAAPTERYYRLRMQ